MALEFSIAGNLGGKRGGTWGHLSSGDCLLTEGKTAGDSFNTQDCKNGGRLSPETETKPYLEGESYTCRWAVP